MTTDPLREGDEYVPRHRDSLSTVQSALRVLEFVAEHDDVFPKGIAAGLGLTLGTTYHLVNTLLDEGYLVRRADRSLTLGDRLPLLLTRLDRRLDPFPELAGELAGLATAVRSVAVIGRLVGRETVIAAVQSFPGAEHQRLLRVGLRGPAHTMALGKVLMAKLSRLELRDLLDDWPLVPLTARTVTRRDVLLDSLEQAGRRGYALDLEEGVAGLTCVAAPIVTPLGQPPAAIAAGLTPDQFKFEAERLVGQVVAAARRSSAMLADMHAAPTMAGRPDAVGERAFRHPLTEPNRLAVDGPVA
jgi:DNA-binding IclR family transcriptional regulator